MVKMLNALKEEFKNNTEVMVVPNGVALLLVIEDYKLLLHSSPLDQAYMMTYLDIVSHASKRPYFHISAIIENIIKRVKIRHASALAICSHCLRSKYWPPFAFVFPIPIFPIPKPAVTSRLPLRCELEPDLHIHPGTMYNSPITFHKHPGPQSQSQIHLFVSHSGGLRTTYTNFVRKVLFLYGKLKNLNIVRHYSEHFRSEELKDYDLVADAIHRCKRALVLIDMNYLSSIVLLEQLRALDGRMSSVSALHIVLFGVTQSDLVQAIDSKQSDVFQDARFHIPSDHDENKFLEQLLPLLHRNLTLQFVKDNMREYYTSMRMRFSHRVQISHIRIVTLGHGGAGKTTLLNALKSGTFVNVDSTARVEFGAPTELPQFNQPKSRSSTGLKFKIFDFPGQPQYYSPNALFLSPHNSILLVVVDVSLDVDEVEREIIQWLCMANAQLRNSLQPRKHRLILSRYEL